MGKSTFDKDYNELMELLDQVPGVKEHMNKLEVRMGKEIFQRRLDLGLTQSELVERILANGDKITQATISKVESGETNVGTETYNKILNALGGVLSVQIEFGDSPKRNERELEYA